MKHFHRFTGLIAIALACSVATQGSAVVSAGPEKNLQKEQADAVYNISVSSGSARSSQASANLTISGENSKVSVEKKGSVTLVAGKSIVLHPGTIISHGSFLCASIEPAAKAGKSPKKKMTLVTIEEKQKIDEQASLATACNLFSPFPGHRGGLLNATDEENGSFSASCTELYGISPEHQRKVALDSRRVAQVAMNHFHYNIFSVPVYFGARGETTKVLRL